MGDVSTAAAPAARRERALTPARTLIYCGGIHAKITQIVEGTNQILRVVKARALLK
jgi:alkylation response protein AidB-like acyl-CoA dehydrogenase